MVLSIAQSVGHHHPGRVLSRQSLEEAFSEAHCRRNFQISLFCHQHRIHWEFIVACFHEPMKGDRSQKGSHGKTSTGTWDRGAYRRGHRATEKQIAASISLPHILAAQGSRLIRCTVNRLKEC